MAVSIVFEHRCNYDLFGTCSALTSIRQIGQQQPGIQNYSLHIHDCNFSHSF